MDFESYLTIEFSVAILAGFAGAYVRGFTGFGANLIWAPALVTVIEPVQAVAIMGIVGLATTTQIAVPILKHVSWKEVFPIIISSWITAPLGIWVLYDLDAENVR
ncbi:MAG: sulfite exporter TauE/SafE family protein, partial [Pseudomonadota bacterium]|nr:sulfite exporter TauE/SafE family protein [Pseudomonadota bacterium]